MRILVIGASGFLGAQVYQRLQSLNGLSVMGTCGRNRVFPKLCPVDLESYASVRTLMIATKPEAVLWCAKGNRPQASEARLHHGGLRAVIESGPPAMRLVFVSTDAVLPGRQGPYDEHAVADPGAANSAGSPYAAAKFEAEQWVTAVWDNTCVVRISPVYGPSVEGAWDLRVSGLLTQFRQGHPVQRATNLRRTFVHVHDLARSVSELILHDYRGILHLGPAESASYFDFAKAVAEAGGWSPHLAEPYVMPREALAARGIKADTSLDTRIAREDLSMEFRPLGQAMRVPWAPG